MARILQWVLRCEDHRLGLVGPPPETVPAEEPTHEEAQPLDDLWVCVAIARVAVEVKVEAPWAVDREDLMQVVQMTPMVVLTDDLPVCLMTREGGILPSLADFRAGANTALGLVLVGGGYEDGAGAGLEQSLLGGIPLEAVLVSLEAAARTPRRAPTSRGSPFRSAAQEPPSAAPRAIGPPCRSHDCAYSGRLSSGDHGAQPWCTGPGRRQDEALHRADALKERPGSLGRASRKPL
mmetsp:Transcript_20499/g.43577  ORF Transcript_20499/g.43577 Transcript_20499/m.43577 type:complete len:236 (-) Transcript_20499:3-710(-)